MKDFYTKEQIKLAKKVNLITLLKSRGEELATSGSEYVWLNGSDKVNVRGNLWYHHNEKVGGDALDFVMKFYNMELTYAVAFLLEFGVRYLGYPEESLEIKRTLYIPKAHEGVRRVLSYLVNKCLIDTSIVYAFVNRKLIYESKKHHNVVFVGYDKDSNIRHIYMVGSTTDKQYKSSTQGSNLRYCFHWNGTSDTLYLFESPIDLLSYITLQKDSYWKDHTYVASCSVKDRALLQALRDNPSINKIILCFNNYDTGKLAMQKIERKFKSLGYKIDFDIPICNNWNEDLIFKKERGWY